MVLKYGKESSETQRPGVPSKVSGTSVGAETSGARGGTVQRHAPRPLPRHRHTFSFLPFGKIGEDKIASK